MSSIPLPPGLRVNGFSMQPAAVTRAHAGPFGGDGAEAVVDLLQDRWRASFSTTATTRAESGAVEAWLAAQRGGANTTPLHHFARPYPLGTLGRQHAVYGLLADAAQGADSVQLATVPGATLLAGDMVGVSGLLLQCAADCVADGQGVITVPLVNRLRRALTGLRRASTATFVDSAGVLQTAAAHVARFEGGQLLVEPAATNLLVNSSAFDAASWTKQGTTVFPALFDPAPTGESLIADALIEDSTVSQHDVYTGSFTGALANSFSVWVKPAGVRYVALYAFQAGIVCGQTFDLVDGVIGSAWAAGAPISTVMRSIPGGYFRIGIRSSVPFGIGAVCLCNGNVVGVPSYLGNTGRSVYLFGAQMEAGGITSTIPTTTAPATRAADVIDPAIWNKPTRPFRLASRAGVRHAAGYAEGLALDFVEDLAP